MEISQKSIIQLFHFLIFILKKIWKDTCTSIFITVWLTVDKTWKRLNARLQWMNKNSVIVCVCVCVCVCAVFHHSVVSDSLQHHVAHQAPASMGILQAKILEWVAMPSSRGSSQPRDQSQGLTSQVDFLPSEPPRKPWVLEWVAYPFSRESSWPRSWIGVSWLAGGFFTSWATREAQYTCILLIKK